MKIACLVSNGFEDIEAIGTVAILRRSGIEVDYISVTNTMEIMGSFHTMIKADRLLKDCSVDDYDGVFIPGGRHSAFLRTHRETLDFVEACYQNDKWMLAICAGPSVLGVLGILDGMKFTSYPSTEEFMPKGILIKEKSVVDGKIITAAGAGAVYEFAFNIIEAILGEDQRKMIEKRIQYVIN